MIEKEVVLIAIGGNALVKKGEKGTAKEQFDNLKLPMKSIAKLSNKYKIVITHGNGLQVGNLLLQQECCEEVPKMPLEIIVAQTQGQIGYMIESTLDTALMELGMSNRYFVALLTYVVVSKNDPAFKDPTKSIGPIFSEEDAFKLPYNIVKTLGGYRRVVASPKPITIVEHREIKKLLEMDFIIICCGGGGIPVIRQGRKFSGIEAVIDKDLASAKLAQEINADIFIIATDIEGAAINYGAAHQKFLKKLPLNKMEQYVKEGHFLPGSMAPKVEAIMQFFKKTKKRAIICNLMDIENAVNGKAGTEIIK
jgi:carbamate kinase